MFNKYINKTMSAWKAAAFTYDLCFAFLNPSSLNVHIGIMFFIHIDIQLPLSMKDVYILLHFINVSQ
jgi:hypothetical protein